MVLQAARAVEIEASASKQFDLSGQQPDSEHQHHRLLRCRLQLVGFRTL